MAKINKKMKQKSTAGGGNKQAMQFNHALGQHILKNPLVIQALVEKVTKHPLFRYDHCSSSWLQGMGYLQILDIGSLKVNYR